MSSAKWRPFCLGHNVLMMFKGMWISKAVPTQQKTPQSNIKVINSLLLVCCAIVTKYQYLMSGAVGYVQKLPNLAYPNIIDHNWFVRIHQSFGCADRYRAKHISKTYPNTIDRNWFVQIYQSFGCGKSKTHQPDLYEETRSTCQYLRYVLDSSNLHI